MFYDFAYYSNHLIEIVLPVSFSPSFKFIGFHGLASHGGGLGIITSLVLFSRKYKIKLWFLLDQIALAVPLAGASIRLGNLFNSEIIGKPTHVKWAFIFSEIDSIPRHPAQLYEAIAYFLIFVILYLVMHKTNKKSGFYFGLMLVLLFILRLLIEFIKEDQVDFEQGLYLNMGQLLSIPFILTGVIIMILKSRYRKP